MTGQREDPKRFFDVLGRAVNAVEADEIPHVMFGSLAAVTYGRPRAPEDIDFLVRRPDADRALDALKRAGFDTEVDNPNWIYKAKIDEVQVDVIFLVKGDVYLDEEMLEHSRLTDYDGRQIRLVSPEDALVMEALSHDPQVPEHWDNATAIIAATDLDWAYLRRRARYGPRRVLSLLIYAQSTDLIVPDHVIKGLFKEVYGG